MAADHDAHDEHHDTNAATNHDPPRKRWVTERADDELTRRARARNLDELAMAVACAPHGDDDVDSHAAAVATRIGSGKAAAIDYCDIGIMLRRMPRIHEFCRSGALPLWHLKKMAAAVIAVSDEHIAAIETHFLGYLRPRRDYQALPGIRVWARELRRIVESVEPISTPPDDDEESASIRSESYSVDNGYPGDHGELHVILRKDRLAEFDAAVRAIRDAKISAGQDCSLGDALMHMCRGDFAGAGVTLNVYADADADEDDLQLWLDGAGWLPKYLTRQWLERADRARLSADSRTDGYVPTDAQKARVRGRDGGCRFPGCNVPAHKCQFDHVIEWVADKGPKGAPGTCTKDAGFIAGGGATNLGVTATWNLQCLCQHHHNLKTSRHWRAVMHEDGSVTWTDHKGTTIATTVPHGPIAHINRQTFDQRATRLTATIRGANARRLRAEADAAAAMEKADIDAAIRNHARRTATFEQELEHFTAGPLNSTDPDIAAEARALADAADDGWPSTEDPTWAPEPKPTSTPAGRPSRTMNWKADADPGQRRGADLDPRGWASVSTDDDWANSPMQRNPDLTGDDWPDEPVSQPGPQVTTPPRIVCRPPRRRATIDADPKETPEPPRPLGPDPTIPF